jgi:hypothetical protein
VSVKTTLRQSWPVLVSYGVFSLWGVACFVSSLALTSGGFGVSPGDVPVVLGLIAATAAGHVGGNLLGLARLRLMPVVALFFGLFIASSLSGIVLGPIAIFLVFGVFAALGGYLGVASRLDVVAAWYPLAFAVGGAVVWMNRHGAVATFESGSKHAVWDGFTIVCLTGAVFLMLVFLATRHSLALTVWQEVGRPRAAGLDPADGIAVARPGRGSLLVLFVFTIAVLGATALISPYLFRTAEAKGGGDGGSTSGQSSQNGTGSGTGSGSGSGTGAGAGAGAGTGTGTGTGTGAGAGTGTGTGTGTRSRARARTGTGTRDRRGRNRAVRGKRGRARR